MAYDRVDGSNPGEGMFLAHNGLQSWFWLSKQTWDEVFVFESWDSHAAGFKGGLTAFSINRNNSKSR
jgi:hypothetical protein